MSTEAKGAAAGSPIRLHVIDRDGFVLGSLVCKVGIRTRAGVITRMTGKTVWTQGKSGSEEKHRVYDGRLPSVYRSHVGTSEVRWHQAPKG